MDWMDVAGVTVSLLIAFGYTMALVYLSRENLARIKREKKRRRKLPYNAPGH